jgi:hypothetical protein
MRWMLASLLLLPACIDGSRGPIDVRRGDLGNQSTSFVCKGDWPSALTPCATPWQSTPSATADGTRDERTLTLTRTPIAVDGGQSVVTITMSLDDQGNVIEATADERTSHPGDAAELEHSAATGGWVHPISVPDADWGTFHIDFEWGSIEGSYMIGSLGGP